MSIRKRLPPTERPPHEPLADHLPGVVLSVEYRGAGDAQLRAAGRLLRNATGGFRVAPHHAEVMAVSADPTPFCSGTGILTFEIGPEYRTPPTMMDTDPPACGRYGRSRLRSLGDWRSRGAPGPGKTAFSDDPRPRNQRED